MLEALFCVAEAVGVAVEGGDGGVVGRARDEAALSNVASPGAERPVNSPDSHGKPPTEAPRRADGAATAGAPSKYPLQLLRRPSIGSMTPLQPLMIPFTSAREQRLVKGIIAREQRLYQRS